MDPDPKSTTTLSVFVVTPEQVVYEGEAEAISSVNNKGPFDILPMHEHFISLVKEKVIVHKKINGEKKEIPIKSGIMKNQDNRINVFLGFESLESPQPVSK